MQGETAVAAEKYALIVEDTADIAGIMQLALDNMNIANQHAPNGFMALEMLESRLPDLMLLDIGMPGMNGWEVLEAIKTRWPDADFPVIVLTAFSDPANRLIGKLQAHVFRYLTKPFDVEELSRIVREALRIA
jgi:two-component system nitrogen regulation response regulator GlnG